MSRPEFNVIIPDKDSYWKHKAGESYQVILVANTKSERLEKYPVTVVYRRLIDNTIWSRPLSR